MSWTLARAYGPSSWFLTAYDTHSLAPISACPLPYGRGSVRTLNRHALACGQTPLEARAAHEICRVVRASGSLVLGDQGILAQRPRPCDRSGLVTPRGRQGRRSFALFHPGNQRVQLARRRRTGTSAAMPDAGCKKKPCEFRRLLWTTHVLLNSLVIIDGSLGGDQLIRPAVPKYRLAAAIPEGCQVRVIGSDDRPVLLHGLIPVTLVSGTRDGAPVKLWVLR